MTIKIYLQSQSNPVVYENAKNSYTKDGMYCFIINGEVYKYPLVNIFRVIESLI